MNLNDSQFEEIEKLSACNYLPEQIAHYLGVNSLEFLNDYHILDSKIRYHYERGILIAQAQSDMQLVESAKKGNITAIQQWQKERHFKNIENVKKRIALDNEMKSYNSLQELMTSGKCELMTEAEKQHYEQMDFARSLYAKYESKTFILSALNQSFGLSRYKATQVFNDALNFFYLDNDIKTEAWANIYAERLDNAARLCFEMNDFDTYRKLILDAAKLRGVFNEKKEELPADFYERKPTLYVIDPSIIGGLKANRNRLADFIDELPDIPMAERERLHAEGLTGKNEGNILNIPTDSIPFLKDSTDEQTED